MDAIRQPWPMVHSRRAIGPWVGALLLFSLGGLCHGQNVAVPTFPVDCALAGDRLLVPVRLNGTGPHAFILDLAIKRPVLHGATAGALNLTPRTLDPLPETEDAVDTAPSATITDIAHFQVGTLPAQPEVCGVADLDNLSARLGTYVAGILPAHQPGYEVSLSFDPPRVVWQPLEYASLLGPADHTTTLHLDDAGNPEVNVQVNGQQEVSCKLDLSLSATGAFTESTLAGMNAITPATPRLKMLLPEGEPIVQLRLGAITVAEVMGARPVCQVSDPDAGDRLGVGFFRQFPVTLNYEHGLVRFGAAEGTGREEASLTGCGVLPVRYVGGYWQLAVVEDSPAFQAGVRPGDLLVGANGLSLLRVTWGDLTKLLTLQRGMRIRLLIAREGQQQFIETVAEDLL